MHIGTDVNTARLVCDVTPQEREDIKRRAKEQGVTLRQYIFESIVLRIKLEENNKVKFSSQE